MKTRWLCFQFNNSNQNRLITALLRTEDWYRVIKFIGISFTPCRNCDRHALLALETSRHTFKSKVGRSAKLLFYRWQYNWIYRKLLDLKITHVACFNGLKGVDRLAAAASKELKIPVLFIETAALAGRVQIDWNGVNYDSSIPREINFYRNLASELSSFDWQKSPPGARQSNKNKSVTQEKDTDSKLSKLKYIFCPLQVPKDSQLTVHGGWIKDIHHFLECIDSSAKFLPNGIHFRIKEHPSSKLSLASHIAKLEHLNNKIVLDNSTDTMDLIAESVAVLTINSRVGLEAFYFQKPVITLGKAFYSFDHLTSRAENLTELSNQIKDIESVAYSELERDLFMRFLYFWYPTTGEILTGNYSLNDVETKFTWLGNRLSG